MKQFIKIHVKPFYFIETILFLVIPQFNYPVQAFKVKFSTMLRSKEFANQLVVLKEELPVGTKYRDYISKWLMTVLMDSSASTGEIPVIKKKVRDELVGDIRDKSYFRRSSFYMCTKVVLQHSLTMQLGAVMGKFLYKIIMLRFMVEMCTSIKENGPFNVDLLRQTIAKMARRIEKLHTKPETVSAEILNLYDDAIRRAKDKIEMIRTKIDEQIQSIQHKDEDNAQLLPLSGLNFESDISQKMTKLEDYLNERNKEIPESADQLTDAVKSFRRYFKNIQKCPKVEMAQSLDSELERRLFWMDFENFILYSIELSDIPSTADELREWSFEYATNAESKYKGNPLLTSRMLLVRLKIIAILDQLAIKQHPLFIEHHSGIEPKIFELLLLPHQMDMKIGYELENYFRQRNNNSSHPSLTAEEIPTDRCFSVRFAKSNANMKIILEQILCLDKENIEKKRTEWEECRESVEKLRTTARSLKCEYGSNDRHRYDCQKCNLIRTADNLKIYQYEHLLPTELVHQYAVVFELKIPETIACLRDTLFDLARFYQNQPEQLQIKENWKQSRISSFGKSSTKYTVMLGSTSKYSMDYCHVDQPFETFDVDNTCNCVFHSNKSKIPKPATDATIKKFLIFQTSGDYEILQWTVNTTLHGFLLPELC